MELRYVKNGLQWMPERKDKNGNWVSFKNEHMNRTIPAGNYEIRQCRSWEANPKGIWSLRID